MKQKEAVAPQEFPLTVTITPGDVLQAVADITWDHRGHIAGAAIGTGLALGIGQGVVHAQGGGPGDSGSAVGPLGEVGVWLGEVIETAAKNPLEIMVPMCGVGLAYGTGQAIWRTIFRETPVEPEESPVFSQLLKTARSYGLELEDPKDRKALAKTLAAFRILPNGGEQVPFLEDLWGAVKVIASKEAREWTSAGVWLYITLHLMESVSRMPDGPGKYGQYFMIAIAAGLCLEEMKQAVLPSRRG